MKVLVYVMLKDGVLDPQGTAVQHTLGSLGFKNVSAVRMGKVIDLELKINDAGSAETQVRQMCEQLLANTVIESYRIEVD